jgi:hypothetical protein
VTLFALVAACRPQAGPEGPPDPPAPTPGVERVEVVVEHGEGGGDHLVGSTVFVAATLDPTSEIVTRWTASAPLALPREWNGAVEVPAGGVVLTPEVRSVAAELTPLTWSVAAGERTGRAIRSDPPTGVVMFFHGASYSVAQLDEPAARSVLLRLVDAGYSVVAVPSEAEVLSGTGGWNASPGSDDHDTVEAVWDALEADGWAPPGVPRIAWGMSSGGQFAHAVGAALQLDVVLAHCAPGGTADLSATSAATGWYLAERDGTFPTAVTDARGFQAALAGRGIATDLYVHPRTPVTPLRFTRVPGVDADRSRALADALLDRGLAGADGLMLESGAEAGRALADLLAGDAADVRAGVLAEIEILAADHELYDDAASRMVAFLGAR